MNKYQKQADGILDDIGRASLKLSETKSEAAAQIAEVRARFEGLMGQQKNHLALLEKELISLCKKRYGEVFNGSDKADLPTGVVIYGKLKWVTRKKGVLENIEAAGMKNLLKIAKSVDWDEVDKLDDETLVALGTERVDKESFSYELKNG